MLDEYFEHPFTLRRLRAGPAGPHVEAFAESLRARGYARTTIRQQVRTAAHFAEWARERNVAVEGLGEAALQAFEGHLPTCHCLRQDRRDMVRYSPVTMRAARSFLDHLRRTGIAPTPPSAVPELPTTIASFERWMRHHRGVKDSTLCTYRVSLLELVAMLGDDPARYDVAGLRHAVLIMANRHGRNNAKKVMTAARMFLRYLAVEGQCAVTLVDAVPRIAGWSSAVLPRYLPAADVERLIASCDTGAPIGMRDEAILLLLARLGLRPSDVVHLRLSDVDWLGARLRVTGKGRRESWLPLPQDVGDSISRYVEHGRPVIDDDHLFIRTLAPLRPFADHSLNSVVKRAVHRSGVKTRSQGAYILRHSAATEMLRQGASLGQIGVVLRHCSINTTAVYAKVDVDALRSIAQPWPSAEVSLC